MFIKGLCILLAVATAACGSHRLANLQQPSVPPPRDARAEDTLEMFMAKVRKLAAEARPTPPSARTLESSDPALAAALLVMGKQPTAASYRNVAREYARLGVLDKAHEHLRLAVVADPRDAEAWEGLARLWRDWGLPHVGLPDAYRAIYHAPASASAYNTLGTLFQALGRRDEARAAYEAALRRDPTAAYALNNICYSWVLKVQPGRAVAACNEALRLQPNFAAARNNLALARAIADDMASALRTFAEGGDASRAQYNIGIVHLARREYGAAIKAFAAAQALRPGFLIAEARTRQARAQAEGAKEP